MDIYRLTKPLLVLLGILHAISANTDCSGKAFQCVNTTHFQICVDLGGGVSSTVDDFLIACPPGTGCLITNNFECEFLLLTTPVEVIQKSDVTNESEWISGPTSPIAVLDLERSEVEHSEKITSNILGNAEVTTDTTTTTGTTTEDSIILNLNASSTTLSTSDYNVKPNTLEPDVSEPLLIVNSESNNATSIAKENFTQSYAPTTLSYIDETVHFVSDNVNPIIEDTSTLVTTLPDIFIASANVDNIFTTKVPSDLSDFQETLVTATAISEIVTESNNILILSVMDDVYSTDITTASLLSNNVITQVSETTPVNQTTFLNISLSETNTLKKNVEEESTTYISPFNYDSTVPLQAYTENFMTNSENIVIADGITTDPPIKSFLDDIIVPTETSDTLISSVTNEDQFIKVTVASVENYNQPPSNVEFTKLPMITPEEMTTLNRDSYTTEIYKTSTSNVNITNLPMITPEEMTTLNRESYTTEIYKTSTSNVNITNLPMITPEEMTTVNRESYTTEIYKTSTSYINEFNAQADQYPSTQTDVNGAASNNTPIVVDKDEPTVMPTTITMTMEVGTTYGAEENTTTTATVREDSNNFMAIDIITTAYPTYEFVTENSLNQVTNPNVEATTLILPEVIEISKFKPQLIGKEMTNKSLLPTETGLDVAIRGNVDESKKDSKTFASSGKNPGKNVMGESIPILTSKPLNTDFTIGVNDNTEWPSIDTQSVSTIGSEINIKSKLENVLLDNSAQYGNTATINLQLIDVTSPEYYLADTVTQAPEHIIAENGNIAHNLTDLGSVASVNAQKGKLETSTVHSSTNNPGPINIAKLQGSDQSITQDKLININNTNDDLKDLKNVTEETSYKASNTTIIVQVDTSANPENNESLIIVKPNSILSDLIPQSNFKKQETLLSTSETVLYNDTKIIFKANVTGPRASPLGTGNPVNVNYTGSKDILQKSNFNINQDAATIALFNNSEGIQKVYDDKSIQVQNDFTTVGSIIKVNDPNVDSKILNKNKDINLLKNDAPTFTTIKTSSLKVEEISTQTTLQQNSPDHGTANTPNPLDTIITNDASQYVSTNEVVEQKQNTSSYNLTETDITISTSSITSELVQSKNSKKTAYAHMTTETLTVNKNTDYETVQNNVPRIALRTDIDNLPNITEETFKYADQQEHNQDTVPNATIGSTIAFEDLNLNKKSQTHIPEQQILVPDLITLETKTEPTASIKDLLTKSSDILAVTDIKKENETQNVSSTPLINDDDKLNLTITADMKVNMMSPNDELKIIEKDTFPKSPKPSTVNMEENVSKLTDINEKHTLQKVEKLADPKPAPNVTTGSIIVPKRIIFNEKTQTHIPEQQTVVPNFITLKSKKEPTVSIKDLQAKSSDTLTVTDIKKENELKNELNTPLLNEVEKIHPTITADIIVNIMSSNDESKIIDTVTFKNNNFKSQTDYSQLETEKPSTVYMEDDVSKLTDNYEKHTIQKVDKLLDPKPTAAPDVTTGSITVPKNVIFNEKSQTHIPEQQTVVPDLITLKTKTEQTASIKDLQAKSSDTSTVTDIKKENKTQNVSSTQLINDVAADIKVNMMSPNNELKIIETDTFKNYNAKSKTDYSKLETTTTVYMEDDISKINDISTKHTMQKEEKLLDYKPTTAPDVTTASTIVPKSVSFNEKSQTHIPVQQTVVPDLISLKTNTEPTASINHLQVQNIDTLPVRDIRKENELQTLSSTALLDDVNIMNATNIADKETVSPIEKLKTTDTIIKNVNVTQTEYSNVQTNDPSTVFTRENVSKISDIKVNVTIKEISFSVNNKRNETLNSFDQSSKQQSVIDASSKMNTKGSQTEDSKPVPAIPIVKQVELITKKQAPADSQIPQPSKIETKKGFDCKSYPRGRYADNKDCRKFYICIGTNQLALSGECPVNTVFSSITKQCTKNLSHCIRNNQFQCTSAGRFNDYLQRNVYYICVKNRLNAFVKFKFQCQNGFRLDRKTVKCVTVTNKKLSSSPQTSSTDNNSKKDSESVAESKSERSTSVSKEKNEFSCDKEGTFADPNDCRRYFVCKKKHSEFRRKRRKCDSDELFNKEKKRCVDAESYECDL